MKNPVDTSMGPSGMVFQTDAIDITNGDVVDNSGSWESGISYFDGGSQRDTSSRPAAAGGSGGSGSSIIGAIISALSNWGLSFYNNRKAEEAATKQYERQLEFWNKQNAYNSYSNQRKLAEDAGLNFAAMHSNGSADASASSLSQVPGNEWAKNGAFRAGLGSIASSMLDLKLKQAQINDIEASARLKDTQSGLTGEQTISQRLDNAINSVANELVFEFDGKTYKGAQLVQKFANARSSLISSFNEELGYRSSVNDFTARESYDWWRKHIAKEVNVDFSPIQQQLLEANLDLTKKEAAHLAAMISDLSSQISYRTFMKGLQENQYDLSVQQLEELKRHNWTVENETRFHNEKTEENEWNRILIESYRAGTEAQRVFIDAIINGRRGRSVQH